MKKIFSWRAWSLGTKILIPLLGLSVISMGVLGYVALANISGLGNYALQSSSSLGERAIQDSTAHLNKLGEDMVTQIAQDVAGQINLYLKSDVTLTQAEMRNDAEFRSIVVQPVGKTGYTTLLDPINHLIVIHKFPEQEKNLSSLETMLPSFWALLERSADGNPTSGYYDWLEVDGSIRQKYASIVPITTSDGRLMTLWATTYISEFSTPADETKKEINAAILKSSDYLNVNIISIQKTFVLIFSALLLFIFGLALLLSHVITSPILALKKGAEAIGRGKLDYKLKVNSKDELGDLANTFNTMASDLENYTEELKSTAAENLAKERIIEDNLHLYVQKVSQAQEAERKRVARELHDETVQSLVVVSRHLDDLASGNSKLTAEDIREEVRQILKEVRHFSQELRPSILDDLGLIPAVKWLASDLEKTYGIPTAINISGDQRQLASETELLIFRIIQEALTNIRKHSQATKALVNLDFTPHAVKIMVQDDGKGFETPDSVVDFAKKGKLGLTGIQERAQLLRGKLDIESKPGEGTRLNLEVPF
jgi:two-component system sensor histidine kinase DegS